MSDDEDLVGWVEFLKQAQGEALPKIKDSAMSILLAPGAEPDAKIAVELGFILLLDKPLILVVPEGRHVQRHLFAAADAVVEWDEDPEVLQGKVMQAMTQVVQEMADEHREGE
jgi:hypothetical protein